MYDEETKQIMNYAKEDLQFWMANAPKNTTEQAISAWQAGYIAGIQRGISERQGSKIEDF